MLSMQIAPQIDPQNPPVFLTASEATKLMKVSKETFYKLIRHNMGPRVVKIGTRNFRILWADFQDWIANPPAKPRPRRRRRHKPKGIT